MKCEIEFLAVGDKSRAGDSIIIRYGEVDNYQIMVVDGGTADTGDKLVSHLKKYFGRNVALEHVVLTHSDADHASGLRELLREIPVKNLWLHLPWLLSSEVKPLFKDKRWTTEGLSAAIKSEYPIIVEICDIAVDAGCNIYYPFQGEIIGPFTVLSPAKIVYLYLLPQFEKTPEADQELIESQGVWIGKESTSFVAGLLNFVSEKIQKWVAESWENEQLKDGGITSASNESSVVLYLDTGEQGRYLLTGDAGIRALTWAYNYAKTRNLILKSFNFIQIPHHGSRRNVGPSILNALMGPILPSGTQNSVAYVSAPASDEKHPRKIVLNAFMRRGARVIATQGFNKIHWGGFPTRPDYLNAESLPFSNAVEEYD